MLDTSPSEPEAVPQPTAVTSVSGGINLEAGRDITIGGDVVGRDKITVGYSVEQVSTLLTQISTTFQPKPFDGRCPYLGLDAFSEDDADRFFGRETLVSELVARVKESRFVVIAGPSGSGKSSLVRAGLIHALKQGALSNSDRWLYATLTPGRDPIESLALAMSRMAKSPDAGKYLREHFAEPDALHEFAESQLSDRKDQRAVIFVDQFEEVFTQVAKEDERITLLNLLTHTATIENGRVTVLFAMRSDFVSNCATYPQLNALLNQQFMQVGAMHPDELVSVIARPALQVGLRIDPDLIAQIVNDMQDEPGALPLMQFALKDLFDAQQAKGGMIALTLSEYVARGGLHKSLERHADAAFAKLSENEQQLARAIFSGLIEIGRGTQDTRRTATFGELVSANSDAMRVKMLTQKLADDRLITTDKQDDKETVTIAHESLIDAWPWLRKLVNENRESIALQNQIVEDAREWDEHQRDASYLYSGTRLATVREELAEQKITLNELAQKFVDSGIVTFESARRRRRRIVQSVISGLVIISLVFAMLSVWAFSSQQAAQLNAAEALSQQKLSRSRELAIVAVNQLNVDPERSLLIAIEALSSADTLEAQNALHQALLAWRLVATLRGHDNSINSLQFSPDGRQIVTASNDQTARVWDTATGQDLAILRGHEGLVTDAQFSPDGKLIVTASIDGTARMWSAVTGQELVTLHKQDYPILSAQFSPDGKRIVTASSDKTARVWDATTGQGLAILSGHGNLVTSAQFSPDGKQIVTASYDGTARVWDAATGQELTMLGKYNNFVTSAQFSPDGKYIVVNVNEGIPSLWDVATSRQLAALGGVFSARFSPDGKQIVTVNYDGTARVWDGVMEKELATLRGHEDRVTSAQFSPDGKQIVTTSDDGTTARVWDAATGQERATLHGAARALFSPDGQHIVTTNADGTARIWDGVMGKELATLRGHEGSVTSAQFSPDGKQIVTTSDDGTTARVWDAATGQELATLRGHEDSVSSAQFSPDGTRIVTASRDDTARVWDAATGQELVTLRGHEGGVSSAQFSPDGKQVVTASSDTTARVWDAATGKAVTVLRGHEGIMYHAQFSLDGKQVVTASRDKTARVWDAATGQELAVLRGHKAPVIGAQFSPDGQRIVTTTGDVPGGGDQTARVWDAATGKELATLRGHEGAVYHAQFSPDGNRIVIASGDQTARVWDAATGQELLILRGHEGIVYRAEFSPNGNLIVTSGCDKVDSRSLCIESTARVWDAATGKELATLRGHGDWVASAQFSPDGQRIVTASADGTARVYVVHVEDLVALARTRVTRELTCEERVQYLHEDVVCVMPTPTT